MIAWLLTSLVLATTPAPPRSANYEEIANLKDFSPLSFEPWSRSGLLGLTGRDGLYVFDPASPGSVPRLVASENVGSARWSPDGGWLVIQVGPRLITIRTSDSTRDTVYAGETLWPYLWASDGRIYGWSRPHDSGRVVVDPPARWRAEHPEKRVAHATIVITIPGPFGFMPGANPSEWSLPFDRTLVAEPFPGDSLYLVRSAETGSSLVDVHGKVIRTLSDSLALWTSVSSDGRLLIGFQEVETPDGETVAHSILHVGDARGAWSLRLQGAPDGTFPKWAPMDDIFCAEDPIVFSARVGRVVLRP